MVWYAELYHWDKFGYGQSVYRLFYVDQGLEVLHLCDTIKNDGKIVTSESTIIE